MTNTIRISKCNCIGCGLCIKLCPDIFDLRDKVAFVQVRDTYSSNLPDAIQGCPTKAIKIWGINRASFKKRRRISRKTKHMTEEEFNQLLQIYNENLKNDPSAIYKPPFFIIGSYLIYHNPICKCYQRPDNLKLGYYKTKELFKKLIVAKTFISHHRKYTYPITKEDLIPMCYRCHIKERNKTPDKPIRIGVQNA